MLDTCVILNGPPNCGKDTIARLLTEYGFNHREMKARLYADTIEQFDLTGNRPGEFMKRATDRDLKERPWYPLRVRGSLDCLSPRQALIYTSQEIKKPQFGEAYFGKAAAEDCVADYAMLAVFSDGGFDSEVACLAPVYKNLHIFRLHREGCTWGNDSRSYLTGHLNTHDLELFDGKPELAVDAILDVLAASLLDARDAA